MNNSVLILVIILLNIVFILIGYILGQINYWSLSRISNQYNKESFFDKQKKDHNDSTSRTPTISIDDTKVVVAIKTDGLEKKYQSLGNTQTSSENISDSVNKLKNMKG